MFIKLSARKLISLFATILNCTFKWPPMLLDVQAIVISLSVSRPLSISLSFSLCVSVSCVHLILPLSPFSFLCFAVCPQLSRAESLGSVCLHASWPEDIITGIVDHFRPLWTHSYNYKPMWTHAHCSARPSVYHPDLAKLSVWNDVVNLMFG